MEELKALSKKIKRLQFWAGATDMCNKPEQKHIRNNPAATSPWKGRVQEWMKGARMEQGARTHKKSLVCLDFFPEVMCPPDTGDSKHPLQTQQRVEQLPATAPVQVVPSQGAQTSV